MNLYTDLKSELDEESSKEAVRLSVLLNGRAAESFRVLHESLGGQEVISRNALAVRILTRALTANEVPKQRRATKVEDSSPKGQSFIANGEGR